MLTQNAEKRKSAATKLNHAVEAARDVQSARVRATKAPSRGVHGASSKVARKKVSGRGNPSGARASGATRTPRIQQEQGPLVGVVEPLEAKPNRPTLRAKSESQAKQACPLVGMVLYASHQLIRITGFSDGVYQLALPSSEPGGVMHMPPYRLARYICEHGYTLVYVSRHTPYRVVSVYEL